MISLTSLKCVPCYQRILTKLTTDFTRSFVTATKKEGTSNEKVTTPNSDDAVVINKNFINRNPRNLEQMSICWKRKGWRYQYPSKEFYHRATLEVTNRGIKAHLDHSSGTRIITCSSNEECIRKHLYSATDTSAAINIGRVFGRRCLEAGITQMHLLDWPNSDQSEKFLAFKAALEEAGLKVEEDDTLEASYSPGIDYDDKEALEELRTRQYKVWCLSKKNLTMKHLNKKIGLKSRARPIHGPKDMTMPSYEYQS